jgi:myosin-5
MDNFIAVKNEYEEEGIDLFDFSLIDNKPVLELLEGKSIGLISILNDECIRPKGSDTSFVFKLKSIHHKPHEIGNSSRLVSERLHSSYEFGIKHFASDAIVVTYNAENFVERNTDKVADDLLQCACLSTNGLIRASFQYKLDTAAQELEQAEKTKVRKKKSSTALLSQFKVQLEALLDQIHNSRTRYIRCIQPNSEKLPLLMDQKLTLKQLASAGLEIAISISRETYPNRLPYNVVLERFACLIDLSDRHSVNPGSKPKTEKLKECTEILLSKVLKDDNEMVLGGHIAVPYSCGKTRVFFRSGCQEVLESRRMELLSGAAARIQRWYQTLISHRDFKLAKIAATRLQAGWRSKLAQKAYTEEKAAIATLQNSTRSLLAKKEVQHRKEEKASVLIQSRYVKLQPYPPFNVILLSMILTFIFYSI